MFQEKVYLDGKLKKHQLQSKNKKFASEYEKIKAESKKIHDEAEAKKKAEHDEQQNKLKLEHEKAQAKAKSDYEEQNFKIVSVDSDSKTIRLSTIDEDLEEIEDEDIE